MNTDFDEIKLSKNQNFKLKRHRNLMAVFTGTMAVGAIATSFISFPIAGGLAIASLVTIPELYNINEEYKKVKTLTKKNQ